MDLLSHTPNGGPLPYNETKHHIVHAHMNGRCKRTATRKASSVNKRESDTGLKVHVVWGCGGVASCPGILCQKLGNYEH